MAVSEISVASSFGIPLAWAGFSVTAQSQSNLLSLSVRRHPSKYRSDPVSIYVYVRYLCAFFEIWLWKKRCKALYTEFFIKTQQTIYKAHCNGTQLSFNSKEWRSIYREFNIFRHYVWHSTFSPLSLLILFHRVFINFFLSACKDNLVVSSCLSYSSSYSCRCTSYNASSQLGNVPAQLLLRYLIITNSVVCC